MGLYGFYMPRAIYFELQINKIWFRNTCYVINNFCVCSTSYVEEFIDVRLNSIALLGPHTQTSFCVPCIVINDSCNLFKYNSKSAVLVVLLISYIIFYYFLFVIASQNYK